MKLDYLFSVKPDEFMPQLTRQRGSDFLSSPVAKELDNAARTLVNTDKKLERITLYLSAQLQHYLRDKIDFTTPLNLNKEDGTVCIRFKDRIDLECLKYYIGGDVFDVEAVNNSIKLKVHPDNTTFSTICDFTRKLKIAINTHGVSALLLADAGMYSSRKERQVIVLPVNKQPSPKPKL